MLINTAHDHDDVFLIFSRQWLFRSNDRRLIDGGKQIVADSMGLEVKKNQHDLMIRK